MHDACFSFSCPEGSLPFYLLQDLGRPGWCNLDNSHVHPISDTVFWKQDNSGGKTPITTPPPHLWLYPLSPSIPLTGEGLHFRPSSTKLLKRFLDGVYFRNIMCRQEWMATEIYRKTISWRGWGNIINHENRAQVAGYSTWTRQWN